MTASATDNCGEVTIDVVESTIAGDCAGDYTITRAFTATDDCGNATSATQTITIVDTTAPVLTNAQRIISCDEYPNAIIYATAEDNCGTSTITYSDEQVSGGCVLPVGQFIRTYTATDDCGNAQLRHRLLLWLTILHLSLRVFQQTTRSSVIKRSHMMMLQLRTTVLVQL